MMNGRGKLLVLATCIACMVANPIVFLAGETALKSRIGVPMRDGARLHTRIVFPDAWANDTSPRPVILIRTPYDVESKTYTTIGTSYANEYGCIVVMQDIRGMHGSAGYWVDPAGNDGFTIFFADAADGADTVAWIKQQPWCTGKIATTGASADAANQITYHAAGAGVDAAFLHAGPSEIYDHWLFPGGALRKNFIEAWLPREGYAWYGAVLGNAWKDAFWTNVSLAAPGRAATVRARAVHFGGWYDCFQQGTIDSFVRYNEQGTDHARDHQFLVMGPWYHGGNEHPGIDYSGVDTGHALATSLQRFVFEEAFTGIEQDWSGLPRVHYAILGDPADPGANTWRNASAWPVPGMVPEPWYLHPGGVLASTTPVASEIASFLFDPSNPVPNGGGTTFPVQSPLESVNMTWGAADNQGIEAGRQDILKFTTEVLASTVEIVGHITASLRVSSNCTDTDITVKLLDVYPDGKEIIVADGILKLRYREGFATPALMVPGTAYNATVDLWSMAYRFAAGHRIRVSVSSSNYPKFAVNDNTGGPVTQFLGDTWCIANNSIHLGPGPVVPCIWLPRTA